MPQPSARPSRVGPPPGSPAGGAPAPPARFSLADLGRAIQAEYPDEFPDADPLALGQAVFDEHPGQFGDLIDPVLTASKDLGVSTDPRVGLVTPAARLLGQADPAREVVAKTGARTQALLAPAASWAGKPPPAAALLETNTDAEATPVTPTGLPGRVAFELFAQEGAAERAKRTIGAGAITGVEGLARGVVGATTLMPGASEDYQAAARATREGISTRANYARELAGLDTLPPPERWTPDWWGQQTGQVVVSVVGLGLAGGPMAAAVGEAVAEAGQTADELDEAVVAGTMSRDEANVRGIATAIANFGLLRGTNTPLFEPVGAALRRVLTGSGVEGLQESVQQIIQNLATGKDWNENLPEAAVIGTAAGGVFAGADLARQGPMADARRGVRGAATGLVRRWSGKSLDEILTEGVELGVQSGVAPQQAAEAAASARAAAATSVSVTDAVTTPQTAVEATAEPAAPTDPLGEDDLLLRPPEPPAGASDADPAGQLSLGLDATRLRARPLAEPPPLTLTAEDAGGGGGTTSYPMPALPLEPALDARQQALATALDQGRLIAAWGEGAPAAPIYAPFTEDAPAASTPGYVPPESNLTLEHLTAREIGTLRRVRTELDEAMRLAEDDPELAHASLVDIMPGFLRQLTGVAEGANLNAAPQEIVEAIDALLEEDRPSPLTDRVVEAAREWHAGRDEPAIGMAAVEPTWQEEQDALAREQALGAPGRVIPEADQLEYRRQRLAERATRLARPERAEVTVEIPGVGGRYQKRRVTLTGRALERFRAEETNAKTLGVPLREQRALIRRAAGVLTESERAAQRAAEAKTPRQIQREAQAAARERDARLRRVGVYRAPADWTRVLDRARAEGYTGGSDRLLAAYHAVQAMDARDREIHEDTEDGTDPQELFRLIAKAGGLTERPDGHVGEVDWWWEHSEDGFVRETKRRFVGPPRTDPKTGRLIARTRKKRVRATVAGVPGVLARDGGKTLDGMAEYLRAANPAVYGEIDGPNALLGLMEREFGRWQSGAGAAPTATPLVGRWWERVFGDEATASAPDQAGPEETAAGTDDETDFAFGANAPFGSEERTAYHRRQVKKILRDSYFTLGSFNLEKSPRLLAEVAQYAANLFVGGLKSNYVRFAAALRGKFPWLVNAQVKAIWDATKAANGDVAKTAAALRTPTTRAETQAIATTEGRAGAPPAPGIAEHRAFIRHLTEILDLVDWYRIIRIEGNEDTRLRVFRQVAEQIASQRIFDPIAMELGMTRPKLAEYFTDQLSLAGRTLGTLGQAVRGNWDAITQLEAMEAAGAESAGALLPDIPAALGSNTRVTRDGRTVIDYQGKTYDVAELRRAGKLFEAVLDDLVVGVVEGASDAPGWLTRLASGSTPGANLGALFTALQEAALEETRRDPVVGALAGPDAGGLTLLTTADMLRKAGRSVASDVVQLQTAFMLMQPKTAIRNATVAGVVLPLRLFTHGIAAGVATAARAHGALTGAPAQTQEIRRLAAEKHMRYARALAGAIGQLPRGFARLTPGIGRPWGETIDEIFQLEKRLGQAGANPRDAWTSLALLKDVPAAAGEFVGYAAEDEDLDVGRAHRLLNTAARWATTLSRWQEYAVRAVVFDAALKAEFARRSIDYGNFLREVRAEQAAAAAIDPTSAAATSTVQPAVLAKYFPNVQEYIDVIQLATSASLELTFAGRGLPGGMQEWWTALFNTPGLGAFFRLVRPFPRFTMNAAMFMYDHSLAALLELPIYGISRAGSTAIHQLKGNAPRDAGGRARGRLARAIQQQTLEYVNVPRAAREVGFARAKLTTAVSQLTTAKRTQRAETARYLREAKAHARAVAAYDAARAAAPALTEELELAPPTWTPPATTVTQDDIASHEAAVTIARLQLRRLRQAEESLTRQKRRLERGGAGDAYLTAAKSIAGTAFLLSTALAIRALMPDREEYPWWQVALPGMPKTSEGERQGATPTLDARGYSPLAQNMLIADLMLEMNGKVDWRVVEADADRLDREHPTRGRWKNWVEAVRINYRGKYTSERLAQELFEGFIGVTREGRAQSILTDAIFGNDPKAAGDPGAVVDALYGLAGALASRYTIPGRLAVETIAAVEGTEEAREQRWTERTYGEETGWLEGPLGAPLENIPGLREREIPSRVDQLTGEPSRMARPWLSILGVSVVERGPLARKFEALGLTPQQFGLRRTRVPQLDNALAKNYAALLQDVVAPLLAAEDFQALSISEQRRMLVGIRARGVAGESVNDRGLLPALKEAAIGLTLGESEALWETYQREKPTTRQVVDFEQFMRAVNGEVEWLREAHGVDLYADESGEGDVAGEDDGLPSLEPLADGPAPAGAPSTLRGSPPP